MGVTMQYYTAMSVVCSLQCSVLLLLQTRIMNYCNSYNYCIQYLILIYCSFMILLITDYCFTFQCQSTVIITVGGL